VEEANAARLNAEKKHLAGIKYGVQSHDDVQTSGSSGVAKNLVLVESPSKIKSLEKYLAGLPGTWVVLATYGHLRDVPSNSGKSVHPDENFRIDYEITPDHVRHANAIVAEAKRCDVLWCAQDRDREGMAIAWHVVELLKERKALPATVHRITFTEITKTAILDAVAHPGKIEMDLVNAQQARRGLDYLVGYNLSPVLWKKIRAGLSAGRVQSPALRMIVEREDEIDAFIPKEHWVVTADLLAKGMAFKAKLTRLDGKKYDPFTHDNAVSAKALEQRLKDLAGPTLTLTRREAKDRFRRPYAPFTTSTLQQAAAGRLGFASARTMNIAQKLYEGITLKAGEQTGLITYMRTDAVNLSEDALTSIRSYLKQNFDAHYLPAAPVHYQNKSKNAQEAHEAIRPTDVHRTPESMKGFLDQDQLKLYTLIWQRAVACQMAPAVLNVVSLDFDLPGDTTFHCAGSSVAFPGFLAVYDTQKDDDEGTKLPHLEEGEKADVQDILAEQKFTEPPPRYNEASIVKHLEEFGIGRPSTYASIIETLKKREYVKMQGRTFLPTEGGRAVGHFLTRAFPPYVDYQFTAKLEDDLDAVARGEREWTSLLKEFWDPFIDMVKDRIAHASREDAKGRRVIGEHQGKPVYVFVGKHGGVIAIGDLTDRSVKPTFIPLPADLHVEKVTMEDIKDELRYPIDLGEDFRILKGRFGPYLMHGETRLSLDEGQDPFTVTLPDAREMLRAKEELEANRYIKKLPEGHSVQNGKWGVFVTDGNKNYASVPQGLDPKEITLEKAKELLAAKKAHGGGKKKFKKKWRTSDAKKDRGEHPSKGGKQRSSVDGLPM